MAFSHFTSELAFLFISSDLRIGAHLAHQSACSLLRLNILPSKRYLIGKPVSLSWKASASKAENIMLNSLGAVTQPCLTPFVTPKGYPKGFREPSVILHTCLHVIMKLPHHCCESTIAVNLGGKPNLAMIFQSRSRLTVSI